MWLAAVVFFAGAAAPGYAQWVPLGDVDVAVDADRQVLWVARSGLADLRGKIAGQAVRARTVALRRARAALHAHADAILAVAGASPVEAERVHGALTEGAVAAGERLLADGSAVVVVEVPIASLVGVWPEGAGRWSP